MAAVSERLFSLELLVYWVRLEAGLLPQPVVSVEEEQEKEEEASPPRLSSSLCPAVAFRLLDFPTLLVYPPGGPASPAPEPRPGLLSFGRGKSCLFRLHPATLHRLLLRTPLYTLLLHLPPGHPTPTPQLLGSCSISLAAAAHKVLGPAASGCSQSHRGSFSVRNQGGEYIGDIALGYRLTDLGSSLLGHFERPLRFPGGALEAVELQKAVEVGSQTQLEKQQLQQPTSEAWPVDADRSLVGLKIPKAQKDLEEIVCHGKANSDDTNSVESGKANSDGSEDKNSIRDVSPLDQEIAELNIESNIFCPPPLYYTHLTQGKTPPIRGKITIKPQMNESEELVGTFLGEKIVNPPAHTNPPIHTNSVPPENPPIIINPPHIQDSGASNQATYNPQVEQNRINMINQLPLLNALLVELSLLYNQPMASPTRIHPHLAWLYRTEDKKSPESSTKSTFKSESKKDKLSAEENKKSATFQYPKNQVENLKKDKHFEKNSGMPPKRAPRGKLLYGLTNTLKLRLKQTNPDMLAIHEKREQYRKMQAQMLGAKLRIQSSKVKIFSFAKQHQKPQQLSKDKNLNSDVSLAENKDTSKQMSGAFNDPTIVKEAKLNFATEKMVGCSENGTINSSLGGILSPVPSIDPEKFSHTNILGGKVEMKVQMPCVFQQAALMDRTVVDKEIGVKQVKATHSDSLTVDANENKPSKNSCSESNSELRYSDDFASTCYSEDFYTAEDTSRIVQAHDSSTGAESAKHSHCTSKSSQTRLSIRKDSSEKSSILSPPFSAGSPVLSHKRSHNAKTQDKSLEEAPSFSSSDLSLSYLTEDKESQIAHSRIHASEIKKRAPNISVKLKTRTSCRSLEISQSPQTSQVSSYLPSNLSELECNVLNSSTSEHFEEDKDEVCSLSISKQCKDICELVINKLPGYTV